MRLLRARCVRADELVIQSSSHRASRMIDAHRVLAGTLQPASARSASIVRSPSTRTSTPAVPRDLREAIRYSLLAPGKRLRPLLVLLAAEACGGDRRSGAAGGLRGRDGPRLFADPRRPAGDGRRRPAPRPADLPQGVRRGDGDPGRRRAADAGLRGAGPRRSARRRSRPPVAPRWPAPPAPRELVGGQADDLAGQFSGGGLEALESIHRRKTGAMFLASLRAGRASWPAPDDAQRAALGRVRPAAGAGISDHRRLARRARRRRGAWANGSARTRTAAS